ncbi:MAG: HTH domain-containing protein [Candidatus Saccharimonadales bacterium]
MTSRQSEILKTIVEYYVQTANPVGSLALARQFGVSSATIRAEMAALESEGLITHPHTSAGRIPTDAGYRYYVESQVAPSHKLDSTNRIRKAITQRISSAGSPQAAIKIAADSLVATTQNVAFATMGEAIYTKGFSQLFTKPEFDENAVEIAGLLDNLELWLSETNIEDSVATYIGEENTVGKSSGCSVIVIGYDSPYSKDSYIGVIGPTRQSYGQVMRIVEHTANTLEELLKEVE